MKIGKKIKYFSFAVLLGTLFTAKCDVVSAATTIASNGLPDTITRGEVKYDFSKGVTNVTGKTNYPFYAEDSTGTYQLYCSDRNNGNFTGAYTLTKDKRLDYGFTHILVKQDSIYTNDTYTRKFQNNQTPVAADSSFNAISKTMVNTWITQMAIWGYQGSISSNELNNGLLAYKAFSGDRTLEYELFSDAAFTSGLSAKALWDTYVVSEINGAKELNAKSPYDATMSINVDGDWTKIDGTDNVKSGLISTSISSGNTGTYSLTFDNAPEGTKVYTEDGKEVTDLKSIPVSSKIYLVVPKSDKKEDYKFSINASSTLTYDAAYQYVDKTTGHQPSILVGPESKDLSASIEMTLAPDTALSVSNSIYFLGFLILISGVFVIYANVKTKEVSE